ncbi:MAG: Gfo/Idh/MocA family oxidoreductase [Clostridiaceae bacterium]|nr:Gfo/Idh/MocA family oxidoreductase [Clostridiaceae bacterium]
MMKTIKLGMIGLGGMGNHHAAILSKMPGVEIVGVCDLIEEKAKKLGEQLNVPWYLDYHQLLGSCEAVWVCTEPFNRRDIVLTCAKEKKHIFTEKPVASALNDAEAMVEATSAAGVIYMLGYCLRFMNPFQMIHKIYASGELGELVDCWTRRYMPYDMSNLWYGWQKNSGGVMLDFGSHDIDWLRWIGGDVHAVSGFVRTVRPTMHADEHGRALLHFVNGGVGSVSDSWSSYLSDCSIGVVGTRGAVIVDRDGTLRKRVGDGDEEIFRDQSAVDVNPQGDIGKKDEKGKIQLIESVEETIQEHFFRCIREQSVPITAGSEGLKTLMTVLALQKSSQTGQTVCV